MFKFIIDEQEYILEWDRKTIIWIESQGLNISRLDERLFGNTFLLFKGMLKKHHSHIATNEALLGDLFDKFVEHYELSDFMEVAIQGMVNFIQTTQENSQKAKLIRA